MSNFFGKARLNLRFSINQKGARKATSTEFAGRMQKGIRAILPRILFNYAEGQFEKISQRLQYVIKREVESEIRHTARQYSKMVVGAGYTLTGPSRQQLTTRAGSSSGAPNAGMGKLSRFPSWPKRSEKYLDWKRSKGLTPNWFLAQTGMVAQKMGKGQVWQDIFGPVRVTIQRKKYVGGAESELGLVSKIKEGTDIRVGLLQAKVEVFGKVTPQMLRDYSAAGGPTQLIKAYDRELEHRLRGRNPDLHRPTLQPFLEFVLTESVPFALQRRIQAGLKGTTMTM